MAPPDEAILSHQLQVAPSGELNPMLDSNNFL